ncbi:hypothetical protein I2486_12795 [Cellulophaga sp. E16_2]|uniref:Lipoprotein n=1 Tax=Cellulophaga algicola (strain DSM 14237 / IC166 / ACAM 630) TaxID=688270 RepID=E6XAI1_CELAD|nr:MULTISPECIES: hypothetical protein [Cellulophaga]ADV49897.1 hypothetical protein Celal_2612 [Cellulophaga algicola DSM 14237]MBO0592279.1 hypothetical protein [Cellulophaga sp. E16_2]
MKKLYIVFLLIFISSCDDGDLQIESLDFNDVDVQTCTAIDIAQANTLFKINDDEALILILEANVLTQEEGTITVNMTSSTSSTITYRIFSDTVTSDYFCDNIPPSSPTVLDEIIALEATIIITTTATGTVDVPEYEHYIELNSITLKTSNDERITDLSVDEFGTITTN